MIVPLEWEPGPGLLDSVVYQLSAAQINGQIVLRWGLLHADGKSMMLELAIAEGIYAQAVSSIVIPPSAHARTIASGSTRRLIQDSVIDLVRSILSCNDQPSIKIAE